MIDRNAWRQTVAAVVDGGIENTPDETAKEMDREFTPNAAVATAVENLLRNGLEQRIRRGEIDERIALIVGDEFRTTLDEQRSVVI